MGVRRLWVVLVECVGISLATERQTEHLIELDLRSHVVKGLVQIPEFIERRDDRRLGANQVRARLELAMLPDVRGLYRSVCSLAASRVFLLEIPCDDPPITELRPIDPLGLISA